jgi:DNA-directed RNA polymerase specialized sigma24 family protein
LHRYIRRFAESTARNLAANEYRHRQKAERVGLRNLDNVWTQSQSESPETELLRDERNRLIQEAIDQLPPLRLSTFLLSFAVRSGRCRREFARY